MFILQRMFQVGFNLNIRCYSKILQSVLSKDDDINVINVLCHDCINSYLALGDNQFRKTLVHDLRFKRQQHTKSKLRRRKQHLTKRTRLISRKGWPIYATYAEGTTTNVNITILHIM